VEKIDDETDARSLLIRVLGDYATEVLSTCSAEEALLIIERERPHELISVIGMPEMDGLAAETRTHSGTGIGRNVAGHCADRMCSDRSRVARRLHGTCHQSSQPCGADSDSCQLSWQN